MQVLSQLSYNPTVGPLFGPISEAAPAGLGRPGCSTGEFRAPLSAGSHHSRLAQDEAQRVLLPRQRVAGEDSTGVLADSICGTRRPLDIRYVAIVDYLTQQTAENLPCAASPLS